MDITTYICRYVDHGVAEYEVCECSMMKNFWMVNMN